MTEPNLNNLIPGVPTVMWVTPPMAREWLDKCNKGNRTASLAVAARYAETMVEGRWKLTHQCIAFDCDGCLLDGQHRLMAVDLAGISVEFMVIGGCDRDTFSVLDVGYRRQAGHLIDHSYGSSIASAARFVGVIDGTLTGKTLDGVLAVQADNDAILAVVDNWPELMEYAQAAKVCNKATRIIESAHLAVLAQAARSQHRDRIPSWLEGLTSGAGLSPSDARLHLRNRFARDSAKRSSVNHRVDAYGLIVRAWNYYAIGTPVGVLKAYRKEEGIPSVLL